MTPQDTYQEQTRKKFRQISLFVGISITAIFGILSIVNFSAAKEPVFPFGLASLVSFTATFILWIAQDLAQLFREERDRSEERMRRLQDTVIDLGALNADFVQSNDRKYFAEFTRQSLGRLSNDAKRAAQGTFLLFNEPPADRVQQLFSPLTDELRDGADWDTVTRPGFWASPNMGRGVQFRDAQKRGAKIGGRVRRILLIPHLKGYVPFQDPETISDDVREWLDKNQDGVDSIERSMRVVLRLHQEIARIQRSSRAGKARLSQLVILQASHPRYRQEEVANYAVLSGKDRRREPGKVKRPLRPSLAIRMYYPEDSFGKVSPEAFDNVFISDGEAGMDDPSWQWSLTDCVSRFQSMWGSELDGFSCIASAIRARIAAGDSRLSGLGTETETREYLVDPSEVNDSFRRVRP